MTDREGEEGKGKLDKAYVFIYVQELYLFGVYMRPFALAYISFISWMYLDFVLLRNRQYISQFIGNNLPLKLKVKL